MPDVELAKYDENQDRDELGRWTSGGGAYREKDDYLGLGDPRKEREHEGAAHSPPDDKFRTTGQAVAARISQAASGGSGMEIGAGDVRQSDAVDRFSARVEDGTLLLGSRTAQELATLDRSRRVDRAEQVEALRAVASAVLDSRSFVTEIATDEDKRMNGAMNAVLRDRVARRVAKAFDAEGEMTALLRSLDKPILGIGADGIPLPSSRLRGVDGAAGTLHALWVAAGSPKGSVAEVNEAVLRQAEKVKSIAPHLRIQRIIEEGFSKFGIKRGSPDWDAKAERARERIRARVMAKAEDELEKASEPTRPSCMECVEKHLGAALVLAGEVNDGYNYRVRVVGHMHEAEDESQAWPKLHDAIRDARKKYQSENVMPDWTKLVEMVGSLRKAEVIEGDLCRGEDTGQFESCGGGGSSWAGPKDPEDLKVHEKLSADREVAVKRMESLAEKVIEDVQNGDLEARVGPSSFSALSDETQNDVAEAWKDNNRNDTYDSEVESWRDGGGDVEIATDEVVADGDWMAENFRNVLEESGIDPASLDRMSDEDLLRAASLVQRGEAHLHAGGRKELADFYNGLKFTELEDGEVHPNQYDPDDPNQSKFPFAEGAAESWNAFHQGVASQFGDAINEEAQERAPDVEPPDYINENVEESLNNVWEEGLDDEEKLNLADQLGYLDDYASSELEMPDKFKLLSDGLDYARTGALGKVLVQERAVELMMERTGKSYESKGAVSDVRVLAMQVSEKVWDKWKESSTSGGGLALQRAAELELGARGRLNDAQRKVADDWMRLQYGSNGPDIVRAYVRAQWEATQYLMEKAGMKEMAVYRGIILSDADVKKERVEKSGGGWKLPDLKLLRNGASSWTTKASVANSWGGVGQRPEDPHRVVLRAWVPAHAVLSLPAYGQNIHSEEEVVVAGTPWRNWDAWDKEAPLIDKGSFQLAKSDFMEQRDAKPGGFEIDLNDSRITGGTENWLAQHVKARRKARKVRKADQIAGNLCRGDTGRFEPCGVDSGKIERTADRTVARLAASGEDLKGLKNAVMVAEEQSGGRSKAGDRFGELVAAHGRAERALAASVGALRDGKRDSAFRAWVQSNKAEEALADAVEAARGVAETGVDIGRLADSLEESRRFAERVADDARDLREAEEARMKVTRYAKADMEFYGTHRGDGVYVVEGVPSELSPLLKAAVDEYGVEWSEAWEQDGVGCVSFRIPGATASDARVQTFVLAGLEKAGKSVAFEAGAFLRRISSSDAGRGISDKLVRAGRDAARGAIRAEDDADGLAHGHYLKALSEVLGSVWESALIPSTADEARRLSEAAARSAAELVSDAESWDDLRGGLRKEGTPGTDDQGNSGVWVTMGGRPVFIREGESASDAMSRATGGASDQPDKGGDGKEPAKPDVDDSIVKEATVEPAYGEVRQQDPTEDKDGDGVADMARVGVRADEVPPPPKTIPRLPNLTADERAVEDQFAQKFEKDPDGVVKEYLDKLKSGEIGDGPNIFNTDDAKLIAPGYNPKDAPKEEKLDRMGRYNAAVHATANAIAKRAFMTKLDELAKLPADDARRTVLITSGGVACHGKGTPIIMFDGSVRPVEAVVEGDLVMGPDSTPRRVLRTHCGRGMLYRVVPNRGDSFVVNEEHVLALKTLVHENACGSREAQRRAWSAAGVAYAKKRTAAWSDEERTALCTRASVRTAEQQAFVDSWKCSHMRKYKAKKTGTVFLTVREALRKTSKFRNESWLYRAEVDFAPSAVQLDPYFLGLWLGDGLHTLPRITAADPEIVDYLRCVAKAYGLNLVVHKKDVGNKAKDYQLSVRNGSGRKNKNPLTVELVRLGVVRNKHIPDCYLVNSRQARLRLLAGLLDSDGSYDAEKVSFEFTTKFQVLADQVQFLVRSLGFAAGVSVRKIANPWTGVVGTYYRLHIGGNNLDAIPTLVGRKRASARRLVRSNGRVSRNVLHTGYRIEPVGEGEFFGFTLDKDHLYLLGDFTVTHNSGKGFGISTIAKDLQGSVGAVWDAAGEQNATENPWIMKELEARGLKGIFAYVHADPTETWENPKRGVVERAGGKGRMVDARVFADSYAYGAKNFKAFADKYKGKAEFLYIDNARKKADGSPDLPAKMDGMPKAALDIDAEVLYSRASKVIDGKKDLKPSVRRGGSIGRRIWGMPKKKTT